MEDREYRRVAIISHDRHALFIEDIPLDILEEQYHGEDEDYIKDTYNIGEFSWDYIIEANLVLDSGDVTEINIEDLKDIN